LLGFGFAAFSSPNMNAIMSSVEHRLLGVASGLAGTMSVLGQLLSMGIATLVLALIMGRVSISAASYPELINGIKIALMIFSSLTFAGIIASLRCANVRKP